MFTSLIKTDKKDGKKFNISAFLATKTGKQTMMMVVVGVVLLIAGPQLAAATGMEMLGTVGMIAGILVMVMPMLMKSVGENRRKDSIDSNLPIFLLSLVSSVESGLSLLRAVEEAANRNMGSLTPELKNLRANISWGMPYHEAFDVFTKKVGTKLARRVSILLQISMDIGGNITDTLNLIQHHVSEMRNIEKDRKSQLAPYIYTIYISFVVFLAISLILTTQFFTEIQVVQDQLRKTAEEKDIQLGMFGSILGVKVNVITSLMFNMALVEAIFGGIAAGKIGESSFVAGIKHVIILIVITVLAFAGMGAV
ncbi:MAG: type II secretion system F family protein [Nitrososphaerota archaeon]